MKSYISPKIQIRKSKIHGIGLFTIEEIKKDEIIGIKSGHIIDRVTLNAIGGFESKLVSVLMQIADEYFIGALGEGELEAVNMHVNHSCEPSVGILGNIINVAMRDIPVGEELAVDYSMAFSDPAFQMKCSCESKNCRQIITGDDWKQRELQKKYKGYFSSYIQKKIDSLDEK